MSSPAIHPRVCERCKEPFLVECWRKDSARFCSRKCHGAAAARGKVIDLEGKSFGRLTALCYIGRWKTSGHFWKCQCSCGSFCLVPGNVLRAGNARSCGCLHKEILASRNRATRLSANRFIGQRFAKFTVLGDAPAAPNGQTQWTCLCECGVEKVVLATAVKTGVLLSCGCINRSTKRKTVLSRHTHPPIHRICLPEYRAWYGMKTRCTNQKRPEWKDYGGRGIGVCDRWFNSFENFLSDVGPRPSALHSLDRIDVDGNYEPNNVRWATAREQALNTRRAISYRLLHNPASISRRSLRETGIRA